MPARKIPAGQKRRVLSFTLSPEAVEALKSLGHNSSRIIERLILEAEKPATQKLPPP
jgi:hypothetical protein